MDQDQRPDTRRLSETAIGRAGGSVRQRRLHRTWAAAFLVSLNSPCTQEELASIEWESLDYVPHWCFLTPDRQRYLQLLCGAVFVGPSMVRWIDGEQIQAVCRLVGHQVYTRIIASVSHQTDPKDPINTDVESLLLGCGRDVLLGAVAHQGVRVLLRPLFEATTQTMDTQTANTIYKQAIELYDQTMAQAMDDAARQAKSEPAEIASAELA